VRNLHRHPRFERVNQHPLIGNGEREPHPWTAARTKRIEIELLAQREFLFTREHLVEARALARAENRSEQIERGIVGMRRGRHAVDRHHGRERGFVVAHAGPLGADVELLVALRLGLVWLARNRAEVLGHHLLYVGRLDVAGNR